ncbi:hypothetical protein AGMMS49957_04060 [Synergistales bacterium]|nr:hypothetical protein AGMMS49957_04060 [Synergistales bacterium]
MADKRPKTAVFAYSEVGFVCLKELIFDGADVAVVFTHRDDPGEEHWFGSVEEFALAHDILVRTDDKLNEGSAALLRSLDVELIWSFYYRAIIGPEILSIPRLGSYNMHGSLLPKYRGRACVNWAIINGEETTGATLHAMNVYADRGDIVDQEAISIDIDDTSLSVSQKIADAARAVLSRSYAAIESGAPNLTPQDETKATKFGRRTPSDGLIDWNKSAVEIYNLVRALTHPFPGAFAVIDGQKTYIWRARPLDGPQSEPGKIVSKNPLIFATGDGLLEVTSFQPDGESERSLKI